MSISSKQEKSPNAGAPAHGSPYVHEEEAGKPKHPKKIYSRAGIIAGLLVAALAVNGWMNRNETGTGGSDASRKEANTANTREESVHSQNSVHDNGTSDTPVFIDRKSSRMVKIQQINNRIDSLRQLIQFQANEIDRNQDDAYSGSQITSSVLAGSSASTEIVEYERMIQRLEAEKQSLAAGE